MFTKGNSAVTITNYDFRIAGGRPRLIWVNGIAYGWGTEDPHVNIGEPVHVTIQHKSGTTVFSRAFINGYPVNMTLAASAETPLVVNSESLTLGGKTGGFINEFQEKYMI